MIYITLDTCVLLDISTKNNNLPLVSALEALTSASIVTLVIPKLVITEYNRNKDAVARRTSKRLSYEFKQVKKLVNEFASENKQETIDVLNDIDVRLPLLTEANYTTINRVESLIDSSIKIDTTESAKISAVQRALDKQAPFHINKNSVADAIIIEQFAEFASSKENLDNLFIFITHNHTDFSANDHRKPHSDFNSIFSNENICYFNTLVSAINEIDSDILAEIKFEEDYTEETRGLQDILDTMDELLDKIWYNRHQNLRFEIDNGDIQIVPKGTPKHGNDIIHEDILQGAIESAKKVEKKYEDVGPWSDFEWGMLNGKLSALRWVLGDDWDMLDT